MIETQDIKNGIRFIFNNNDEDKVADAINKFFIEREYKIEAGDKKTGAYGYGNWIMRILFGAFVKRFKFYHEIKSENGKVVMDLTKDTAAKISGGAIGYKQGNDEFAKLIDFIKALEI